MITNACLLKEYHFYLASAIIYIMQDSRTVIHFNRDKRDGTASPDLHLNCEVYCIKIIISLFDVKLFELYVTIFFILFL